MNLPHDFETYTRQLMGDTLYGRLAAGLDTEPSPVSIRLNPFKCRGGVAAGLADTAVPWCASSGRYLRQRPNFTFDPLMHAGAYYVQEAASMIVDHVVRTFIKSPVQMLDLCAAPGGKSTALRAALPEGSLLFSNEPIRTRAQILSENIQKFGHEDVVVTNNYPRDYRKAGLTFDAILADVPCSGEGMFRKDDGARQEWSVQNVEACSRLQREIVADIWPCLKPGGLLVYSTCTFNAHEDEENVEWIAGSLGADILSLPVDSAWNIMPAIGSDIPACRFLPGISRSEGLFVAVLRKRGDKAGAVEEPLPARKERRRGQNGRRKEVVPKTPATSIPLVRAEEYERRMSGDTVLAIPGRWADTYDAAAAKLKVVHAGTGIGTVRGRDIIPHHSLALARQLDADAYPRVEIEYADAVSYLRKEAVVLPEGTPRGFVVITYRGMPLGFEKNIGNRANNLYPQEWRIKSTHVPQDGSLAGIIEES